MTTERPDEVNAVVLNYLRKMGFRQTEQLFKEEAHVAGLETMAFELRNDQDASISNYLLFSGAAEVSASLGTYEQAYQRLKQWSQESLDVYKDELAQVLYPVGVHAYLDLVAKGLGADAERFLGVLRQDHEAAHGDELARIEVVRDAVQIKECPVTSAFRSNKYNVTMGGYAFQLLMGFLQEGAQGGGTPGNVLLLKIINQFVNIRVTVSKAFPGMASKAAAGAVAGITGLPSQTSLTLNRQPIQWGAQPFDPAAEQVIQQNKPKDPGGRPIMHDPLSSALAKYKQSFVAALSNLPDAEAVPRAEPGPAEIAAEVDRLKELGSRAVLSAATLPSISCYTLHNTYDGVTSIDMSPDGRLLATGSRDSYIDVWSLTSEPLRTVKISTELASMDLSLIESLEELKDGEGSPTKRLVGHAGPVYATRFLPPAGNRFMLSASQDRSLRLWSLDLFAPVVVYRSHTLPVWDVDVPPFAAAGPYFASASADRTARLWSTEHIHPLRIFAGHLSDVDTVRFHPNGNYVATGSSDKTCRLWDVQTGHCVRLFTGHERGVTAMAVSPDGRLLASGDRLGHVRLWDLGEGKLLRGPLVPPAPARAPAGSQIATADSPVYSLAFCQDGRVLAQCGADATVHLWDMARLAAAGAGGSDGLLASYPTKQTPLYTCQFTRRNVLVTAGIFNPDF